MNTTKQNDVVERWSSGMLPQSITPNLQYRTA